MAKKRRKKASRRRVAKRTGGRRAGAGLRSVPTDKLQAELDRRSNDLTAQRDELAAQLAALDAEISSIGPGGGASNGRRTRGGRRRTGRRAGAARGARAGRRAGARKRPRNAESLEVALSKVLKGKTMGVSEVAAAVQKAGYKTSSPNFRTIVNQTLIRSELIKKLGRGAYTAA